jgi:hypothetical protein
MDCSKIEETPDKLIINFLNNCEIKCTDLDSIIGIIIPREQLLSIPLYDKVKNDIPKLKPILHSSVYTSVQKNAEKNQKWPLLNLIRQLLRRYQYDLKPKRVCDGYTKDGQKKYKRFFEIHKTKPIIEK